MVEKGYKQTEVGVIPEDWEVDLIGNLLVFKNGLNKAREFFGYGTPIVNYMDVYSKNTLNSTDIKGKVFLSNSEIQRYEVKVGDVFFTRTSETPEEVGISSVVLDCHKNTVFSGFILRGRPVNNKLFNKFKSYCFQTKIVRNSIIQGCTYTTRALTNGTQLSKIRIPLPPLPEQTAIAEALSDMDALIAQTEQLIEKKKAIKQGMMHELLTPKEGWVTKKLGEIAELKNGYAFKSAYYNQAGEFLIITIANVQDGHMEIADCNRISHIPDTVQSFQKLNIGDILISMTGNVGRICKVNTYKTLLNQRVGKITPTNIDGDFLFYLLRDKRFINKMILSAQGGAQGNIGKSDILDYEASLPPTPKEQARIAQILLDMDSEIEQLEKQLSKAQSIKQGMMQQLLTGKTRLI